jgi:hypothetical protein
MATAILSDCIGQIGETAGDVWHLLDNYGPMALTKITKEIDAPRDVVMQAIGWLAREDKVTIDEEGRSKIIGLIED